MYSFRLVKFCLLNYLGFCILCMSESLIMLFPMKFLMFFSIMGGSMLMWMIFPFFNLILLNLYLKFLTLFICLLGCLIGLFFLKMNNMVLNYKLNYFFSTMWFMPLIFCIFFNNLILKFINKYIYFLDMGWFEFLGGGFFLKYFNLMKIYFYNFFNYKNLFLFFLLYLYFIFI